ncbi:MAG: hypothetical protein HQK83_04220 [Fibrobacteria bacterium]|nr:hypothetical protein [Fibrobacteria bacterium]
MSILKDVLVEERDRLVALIKQYGKEMALLPKGSLSVKKIRNGLYAYRAFREKYKVCFEYLGSVESEKALKFKEKMEERRNFNSLLKDAKKNLDEVQRMLSVAKT